MPGNNFTQSYGTTSDSDHHIGAQDARWYQGPLPTVDLSCIHFDFTVQECQAWLPERLPVNPPVIHAPQPIYPPVFSLQLLRHPQTTLPMRHQGRPRRLIAHGISKRALIIPFRPSDPGFDHFKRGIQLVDCLHGKGMVFPEATVWQYCPDMQRCCPRSLVLECPGYGAKTSMYFAQDGNPIPIGLLIAQTAAFIMQCIPNFWAHEIASTGATRIPDLDIDDVYLHAIYSTDQGVTWRPFITVVDV